jgi:modification methylase
MNTPHHIYIGDSRDMSDVDDESVHLVITSPPYWQLKDYGSEEQIGFDQSYEDYINNLNLVWNECYRVLHNGCRLCVNIGDQFARSVYYGRYKVIPIRTEIIKFCETIGFDYMGAVIWQKVTTTNTSGGASIMGSYPNPRNGILKIDYEFILIFKKPGVQPKVDPELKKQSAMTNEEWNTFFAGHWNFPGGRQKDHLAMFPEELPRRLIKMFSFVGDTVLDPFMGSGTTSLAAKNLDRNSIGFEINPDYRPIFEEKLGCDSQSEKDQFDITVSKIGTVDFDSRISNLPYIFKDPIKIDKKVDPRSNNFGTKVNQKSEARETYFTVKQVLSPTEVVLNDGKKITLLGLRPLPNKLEQAVDYLHKKVHGKKIYLRQDDTMTDQAAENLCYLYLANKTFVNAHLVRDGLVDVDMDAEFKYKKRFLSKRPSASHNLEQE